MAGYGELGYGEGPYGVGLTGAKRKGFFYPRIEYGTPVVTIDFADPAEAVGPWEQAVRAENVSLDGTQETLHYRTDLFLALGFRHLSPLRLQDLRIWWRDHARLGKQSKVTLDSGATITPAGQIEYDLYNASFDKAHLLTNPFRPGRSLMGRALYVVELVFRQGV